jgi:hypothetical protein
MDMICGSIKGIQITIALFEFSANQFMNGIFNVGRNNCFPVFNSDNGMNPDFDF